MFSNGVYKFNPWLVKRMSRLALSMRRTRFACFSVGRIARAQCRPSEIVRSNKSGKSEKVIYSCAYRSGRGYHASTTLTGVKNPDLAEIRPTEEELNETSDTIGTWQNPNHHDSDEMKKTFADASDSSALPTNPLPPFEVDTEKVVAPLHIQELADQIVNLKLLELKELTDKIADHFGFDDTVMAASYGGSVAIGGAIAAPQEDVPEEKVIFDLKLMGFDAKAKIKVIKEVRAIAGLGLKEAKELVESAPKVVQKDLKQDKADELKAQLEAVGAQVEIV